MDKRAVVSRIKAASKSIDQVYPFPELRSGSLPRSTAIVLFAQYQMLSDEFPKVLCTVAARLSSDHARTGIISNLWDEHGRGDIRNSHRAMLQAFMTSFHADTEVRTLAPTWQTRLFLNGIGGIAERGSLAEAIGMLLFFEAVTPSQYRAVIAWLEKSTALTGNDLQFWSDHVEHDGDHLRELLDNTLEHENVDQTGLLNGLAQSRQIEAIFWRQFE
jgi:pyrroloquinoline quinone (PQQ) biosynthesis protein C